MRSVVRKFEEEEAYDLVHSATKKENAKRRWDAGGLKAASQKGGIASLIGAAKNVADENMSTAASIAKGFAKAAAVGS